MKKYFILIFFILIQINFVKSQNIRVAILDFDNLTNNAKYDGLGKALSSMLISDIESNISSKKIQLIERGQLNKIVNEQKLQKTKAIDKTTSVKVGKLLGVNYLLIGDVFIMNDKMIINARLTDAENGDIKFSKNEIGNISQWIKLKSNISQQIAISLSLPIQKQLNVDQASPFLSLIDYGNAITAIDKGEQNDAENLIANIEKNSPEFTYLKSIKSDLFKLKEDIKNLKNKVDILVDDPIGFSNKSLLNSDTLLAIQTLSNAIIQLKENDPYFLNKKLFLLNNLGNLYLGQEKFILVKDVLSKMYAIDSNFMYGKILDAQYSIIVNNYENVDNLIAYVKKHAYEFNTVELKNKSKLIYNKVGFGYAIKSGYKEGYSDFYIPPMEFPNAILEIVTKENKDKTIIEKYWTIALNEIVDTFNIKFLLLNKPLHLIRSINNLLWTSAKYSPSKGMNLLNFCIRLDNYFHERTTKELESILKYAGFVPKDPYFQNELYKEAFFKQFDYLNFKMNQAHILYLNKNIQEALAIYCQCINDYDPEYIKTSQLVKNFRDVILNDFKELSIDSQFLICK